jgi:hypothetical protein
MDAKTTPLPDTIQAALDEWDSIMAQFQSLQRQQAEWLDRYEKSVAISEKV